MNVPEELRYSSDHEWLRVEAETVRVGITDFAQDNLGDVVFVQVPEVGAHVAAGDSFGEIESTKSVGELFAPVDGEVVEANQAVIDAPELVNSDPFGEGWLIKVTAPTLPKLLTHDEYRALTGE